MQSAHSRLLLGACLFLLIVQSSLVEAKKRSKSRDEAQPPDPIEEQEAGESAVRQDREQPKSSESDTLRGKTIDDKEVTQGLDDTERKKKSYCIEAKPVEYDNEESDYPNHGAYARSADTSDDGYGKYPAAPASSSQYGGYQMSHPAYDRKEEYGGPQVYGGDKGQPSPSYYKPQPEEAEYHHAAPASGYHQSTYQAAPEYQSVVAHPSGHAPSPPMTAYGVEHGSSSYSAHSGSYAPSGHGSYAPAAYHPYIPPASHSPGPAYGASAVYKPAVSYPSHPGPHPVVAYSPPLPHTPVIAHGPVITHAPAVPYAPAMPYSPVITHSPVISHSPVIPHSSVISHAPAISYVPVGYHAPAPSYHAPAPSYHAPAPYTYHLAASSYHGASYPAPHPAYPAPHPSYHGSTSYHAPVPSHGPLYLAPTHSYHGAPSYHGSPAYHGTPAYHGGPVYHGAPAPYGGPAPSYHGVPHPYHEPSSAPYPIPYSPLPHSDSRPNYGGSSYLPYDVPHTPVYLTCSLNPNPPKAEPSPPSYDPPPYYRANAEDNAGENNNQQTTLDNQRGGNKTQEAAARADESENTQPPPEDEMKENMKIRQVEVINEEREGETPVSRRQRMPFSLLRQRQLESSMNAKPIFYARE